MAKMVLKNQNHQQVIAQAILNGQFPGQYSEVITEIKQDLQNCEFYAPIKPPQQTTSEESKSEPIDAVPMKAKVEGME